MSTPVTVTQVISAAKRRYILQLALAYAIMLGIVLTILYLFEGITTITSIDFATAFAILTLTALEFPTISLLELKYLSNLFSKFIEEIPLLKQSTFICENPTVYIFRKSNELLWLRVMNRYSARAGIFKFSSIESARKLSLLLKPLYRNCKALKKQYDVFQRMEICLFDCDYVIIPIAFTKSYILRNAKGVEFSLDSIEKLPDIINIIEKMLQ